MLPWKSALVKPYGRMVHRSVRDMATNALEDQQKIFTGLIEKAASTLFGIDHQFGAIKSYKDFQSKVPIRDYEGIKDYIEKIKKGTSNVLWPGQPLYFAKTSGTTSGIKYIPLTKDSMPYHFSSASKAVMSYAAQINDFSYLDGKLIFLSGSPETSLAGSVKAGRLSGLVNLHIPALFKLSQLPSYATNCIEDWDIKVEKIIDECVGQDLRLISGIPPWVQMFAEKILNKTGKSHITEVFPNLKLLVSGGVNFAPYKSHYDRLFGPDIPRVDTYPASEGFIGFQFEPGDSALILNTRAGIFFEFVTLDELKKDNPHRLTLAEVTTGVTYALLLSTNAGLWCYNIGDTIEFLSVSPYRFVINGRVSQYISAFGEHVIEKEVETALLQTCEKHHCTVSEYTIAPQVNPEDGGKSFHEWFIDFEHPPLNFALFTQDLDAAMREQNIYYDDLITGNILRPIQVKMMKPQSFRDFMRDIGKLGGQNKIPHLRNDRKIANGLSPYLLKV
ncbi:MAG: GH3 auxin-responsive promoter family protein [Saprospiraceae bacterium]